MSDEADTVAPEAAISYPIEGDAPISVEDAARGLSEAREKALNPKSPAKAAEAAPADPELPAEGDTDPAEEPPIGEGEEGDPPAQEPIARPKSWTEAEDAEWKATPRPLQEKIVARELDRDNALRKSQNEAADKLKGLTAKEQAAESARQQYEAKLPALMQALHNTNNTAFSDIKSQDDADLLAQVDPARWVQWQAHQQKMAAVNHELQQAEGAKTAKKRTEWGDFVTKQNALVVERIPELADPEKSKELGTKARDLLLGVGFTQAELNAFQEGEAISPYDHRLQDVLFKAVKLSGIEQAKKAVATKPLPPVQRPGTPKPASANSDQKLQALEKQLSTATGNRAAQISAEIYALQQRSAAVR